MNKAVVIIPTVGAPELECAVQSVLDQRVPTDVLIVVDGPEYDRPLALPEDARVHKLTLPFNTGRQRTAALSRGERPGHWYGARAFAAAACIVNNDYAMVLDQDNWLLPDHVESCIDTLESRPGQPLQFVHALRNIYRKDGSFLCRDDCESLGTQPGLSGLLIDTSCYFYRTDFFRHTAHLWLSGWGQDRIYFRSVLAAFGAKVLACTGRYSVNYRLGGNEGSVPEALFVAGNAQMYARHPHKPMPWAVE